jgi:hypothetical protein
MNGPRTISELLRAEGYEHRAVSGHGLYRHEVRRISDGTVVGYMTASEACLWLNCTADQRVTLLPHVVGFGGGR